MNQGIFAIGMLVSRYFEPRFNATLQILIFQIRMLRNRIDALKIVPTTAERSELLRLGEMLGHDVNNIMFVVQPKTYARWLREKRGGEGLGGVRSSWHS